MYSRNLAKLQKPIRHFIAQDVSQLLIDLENFKQFDKGGAQRFKLNQEQLAQAQRYIAILKDIQEAQKKAQVTMEQTQSIYEQLKEKVGKDALSFLLNFIETPEHSLTDISTIIIQQSLDTVQPDSELGKLFKDQKAFYKALFTGQYQNVKISHNLFKFLQIGRVRYFVQNLQGLYRKQMDLNVKEESKGDNSIDERINDLFE